MTAQVDNPFVNMPNGANAAELANKGVALDSQRAGQLGENANYLLAYRAPQMLGAGFNGADDGSTYTADTWFTNVGSTEQLYQRLRSIIWEPHGIIVGRFQANSGAGSGEIKMYCSPQPWTGAVATLPKGSVSGSAAVATSSLTEFSIELDIRSVMKLSPVKQSREVFVYVTLGTIPALEGWAIYTKVGL